MNDVIRRQWVTYDDSFPEVVPLQGLESLYGILLADRSPFALLVQARDVSHEAVQEAEGGTDEELVLFSGDALVEASEEALFPEQGGKQVHEAEGRVRRRDELAEDRQSRSDDVDESLGRGDGYDLGEAYSSARRHWTSVGGIR